MSARDIQGEYVRRHKWLFLTERLTGILGLALLGIYLTTQFYTALVSRAAIYALSSSYFSEPEKNVHGTASSSDGDGTDFTLWAKARVSAYRALSSLNLDKPIGILYIPRLRLTAPVFEGTGTSALDRGLGRIVGTATLGGTGNVGIAGHRDGFFRVLKDIRAGDLIEIRTHDAEDFYTVRTTSIVNRRAVSVLRPSPLPSLTLVTCYPFYFIGGAPQRFIVQAVLKQRTLRAEAIVSTPKTKHSEAKERPYAEAPSSAR